MISKAFFDDNGVDGNAAGSQNARVETAHWAIIRIIVLNLPILSARMPGAHRPKNEPPLKIAISW